MLNSRLEVNMTLDYVSFHSTKQNRIKETIQMSGWNRHVKCIPMTLFENENENNNILSSQFDFVNSLILFFG